jgi:outer membrane protein, heavy metal efflux system
MKTDTRCRVDRRAHGAALRILFALAFLVAFAGAAHTRPLTLEDALSRALAADFAVPAAKARIRGAEAGVRQANRPLNPSVGVEVENFAGSGAHGGFKRAETTFFLQQTIEMGGKRAARTDVARSELDATRARGAVRVLDLLKDVEVAWIEVVAATAQARVAEDRLAISLQLQSEIARRGQAGRDPLFTQSRADAQAALEQIAVDQARAVARIARANLAAYWRGTPDFEVDVDTFENAAAAFAAKVLNAEVAVLEAESGVAAARVGLERSRASQDPTVRLGVRHFNETHDAALIAGFSIPLPIFDNNQGNIEKAEAERRAAELDLASARRALRRETTRLEARLAANSTEARRIQSEVIPQAERAVRLIREGLERGAFSYIEFADAQRTLNDARVRRIEVLKSFHLENATLSRLTGRHARLNARKGSRR